MGLGDLADETEADTRTVRFRCVERAKYYGFEFGRNPIAVVADLEGQPLIELANSNFNSRACPSVGGCCFRCILDQRT